MDFDAIKKAAKGYEADMTRFLRDLIAIPAKALTRKVLFGELRLKWIKPDSIKSRLIRKGMCSAGWGRAIRSSLMMVI